MLETTPSTSFIDQVEPQPDLMTASVFVEQYMVSVSGILDLFNQSWLEDQLPAWVADPACRRLPNSPVIYLALAIGALSYSQDNECEKLAEHYFGYGRKLATANLMEEPSLQTVQAFLLISYYMLLCCRRNGAFVNLGVAVRAAYALGIHRHEANAAFVKHEGISRERAWKSLRVCDLFLSASMGRPPATLEQTCNIPWATNEPSSDRENSTVKAQVASAIFCICHVFERILTEVYSKRALSLDLAASISQQHRDWTRKLPAMLKIDGLAQPIQPNTAATCQKMGSSMVIMAYYYSIILLTRPFLTFFVCKRSKGTARADATAPVANIEAFSDGCVDSAIKGVIVAERVVLDNSMPKRHPLIVNSVFISALCLGLSFFGDYDRRRWPLLSTMDTAIALLEHLGQFNPVSTRYGQICKLLREAADQYVRKRDEHLLKSSSQTVKDLFGDVQHTSQIHLPNAPPQRSPSPFYSPIAGKGNQSPLERPSTTAAEALTPNSYDYNSILQESIITTTGVLAPPMMHDVDFNYQPEDAFHTHHAFSLDGAHAHPSSNQNNLLYRDHVPLFSLTDNLAMEAYDASHDPLGLPHWNLNETGD